MDSRSLGLYDPNEPDVPLFSVGCGRYSRKIVDLAIAEYERLTDDYSDEALKLRTLQSSAPASAPVNPM
jgi:hypothetical protein